MELTKIQPRRKPRAKIAPEPIEVDNSMGSKKYSLALALLILFCAGWDLRAVLLDQRPGVTVSDTTLADLMQLRMLVRVEGIWTWIQAGSVKGPLAALLGAGLTPLVGDPLLAVRLLGVLLHGLLLAMVYRLGAKLGGGPAAGLLAALIGATFPMQFGWFRMDFHEPLVAVAVVATLGLLLGEPLRSPAAGALLGLVAGLGLLTKLSYPLFVLLPGALVLVTRLRSRRALLSLVLALAVAAAVISWWLIPSWGEVSRNLADSSHSELPLLRKLRFYLLDLPGVLPLLLAGLAGGLVAWRRRVAPGRALWMLVLSLLGGALPLLLLFDFWSRYLVPLFPVAALLAALGLVGLGRWVAGRGWSRLPRVAAGMLALALLAQYVVVNLRGLPAHSEEREFHAGMVIPDRRPYRGWELGVAEIKRRRLPVIELPSGPNSAAFPGLWEERGHRLQTLHLDDARQMLLEGRPLYALYIHMGPDPLEALERDIRHGLGGAQEEPPDDPLQRDPAARFELKYDDARQEMADLMRFVSALERSVIWRHRDPDGVGYAILRLQPR
jgi:hypothetical protein